MSQREHPSPTQRGTTNFMRVNEALYPGESLISTNGLFSISLHQNDCKILLDQIGVQTLWSHGNVRWSYGTYDYAPGKHVLLGDGVLAFYTQPGVYFNSVDGTRGKCRADTVLQVTDDGNLVLITDNNIVWSTDTAKNVVQTFYEIRVGQHFKRGQVLRSKNNQYWFLIQDDGQAVCSRQKEPYWALPSKAETPESMMLQILDSDEMSFGNWWSRTHYKKSGGNAALSMTDDGNLVLVSDGKIIWCGNNPSVVQPKLPPDSSRTADDLDVLKAGTHMCRGQALLSPNGLWTAKFEADGKFILYRKYWKSGDSAQPRLEKVFTAEFSDKGAHYIYMQLDERITCYGADGENLWEISSFTDEHKGILTLANDGLLKCGRQLNSIARYPHTGRTGVNILRPWERLSRHDILTSDDGVYTMALERGTNLSVWKQGRQVVTRDLDNGPCYHEWTLPDTDELYAATGHRALTIDDHGNTLVYGQDLQVILKVEPLRSRYSDDYWDAQRKKSGWTKLPDSPGGLRLVMEYDGSVRIWNWRDEELMDLSTWDRIKKDVKYALGDTRVRPSPFKPVYTQGEPTRSGRGHGIASYNMLAPNDVLFAYDYDSSGLMDHIVLYNPGLGSFWVGKHTGNSWIAVYAQGYGGNGLGGYEMKSPNDRALAFDWNSSGKQDHILVYNAGAGHCRILQRNGDNGFSPVYSRGGIGDYDLGDPLDQVFAFDYEHTGKLDHLCAYRPGRGAFYILKREGDHFVRVYGTHGGIGGWDMMSPDDRAFAFDWDSSGKMDHIALYRPGDGNFWCLRNDGGSFSARYNVNKPGFGYFDLKQKFDMGFAFDWNKSGKQDHVIFYRPSWGMFYCMRANGNELEVVRNGLQGGLSGFDLLSLQDRMFALDYNHSGKQDHLVLYRANGSGTIWILEHAFR